MGSSLDFRCGVFANDGDRPGNLRDALREPLFEGELPTARACGPNRRIRQSCAPAKRAEAESNSPANIDEVGATEPPGRARSEAGPTPAEVDRGITDRGHNGRSMAYDLDRFLAEQHLVYDHVLEELRRGRKTGHWIWFIFPQIAGLGTSAMSQHFAISSLDEARAYLAHPVLGARLRECAEVVLSAPGSTAEEIFGSLDARKVRSSMTLFHRAAPDDPVFKQVLDACFDSVPDEATDALLPLPYGNSAPAAGSSSIR